MKSRRLWLVLAAVVAILGISSATCPRDVDKGKICSGHGTCNAQNLCACDSRHTGFDCSKLLCPKGNAWVAPARATDDAHYEVECSNKGMCDRMTGTCVCEEGFTGTACQRLACPDDCSDAGDCLSLRQLSKRLAVGNEPIYETIWDANMIYGCKCRRGFHGYDCSKRSCPRGDDPLTTGQANEVQVLRCTATGGQFYLYFKGSGVAVPFDSTLAQFRSILLSLKTLPSVSVAFSASASPICSATATNFVTIEFIETFGPQAPIKVFNNLKGVVTLTGGAVNVATGGAKLVGRASVAGTKEWDVCSNRGHCDESSGQCACFINPMPGYRASDGYGNPGTRADCGCANDKNLYGGPIKACVGELACSGHGYCSGAPSFRCNCVSGWTEGDCAMRTCPSGPSWFSEPSSLNIIHSQRSVCSDAGMCDRVTGQCLCYAPFDGAACEFMKCPGAEPCNGHGRCISIRRLSLEADVDNLSLRFDYGADPNNEKTFDSSSIMGCKCDPGYEGYDCNQMTCPVGDDPTTSGQVDEVQLVKCVASGGTFKLLYRTSTSTDIPFDAPPSVLRDILVSSFQFEDLVVEYSSGSQACSPAGQNVIRVTFPLTFGDIPPLLVGPKFLEGTSPMVQTAENGAAIGGLMSRRGTKERAVCSNKGYCNSELGVCVCASGYASSDGRGNVGNRGDCGYQLPKAGAATAKAMSRKVMGSPNPRAAMARRSTIGSDSAGSASLSKIQQQLRHASPSLAILADSLPESPVRGHFVLGGGGNALGDFSQSTTDDSPRELSTEIRHLRSIGGGRSPSKRACAKLELALQLKDACERDLERYCEARSLRRQERAAALTALASSSSEATVRNRHELERLMRKLAPSMGNVAATHPELVHILQSCAACSTRVAFCLACAKKATEFFGGFSNAELEAIYGGDLPTVDADELDAFDDAVTYREFRALHSRPPSRHG